MKLAPLLAMTAPAYAALHHALISSSTTPEIYTVQFDDSVKTLKLLDTHTAPSPLHRLELSHNHRTLYSTSGPNYLSWSAMGPRALIPTANIPSSCTGPASHPISARTEPYELYGISGNCLDHVEINPDMSLKSLRGSTSYPSGTSVSGVALGAGEKYLYTTASDNRIYIHQRGTLKQLGSITTPFESTPRQLVAHPKGRYLHVLLEGTGQLAEYPVGSNGLPVQSGARLFDLPAAGKGELVLVGSMIWVSTPGYIVGYELGKSGEVRSRKVGKGTGRAGVVKVGDWRGGEKWVGRTDDDAVEVLEWTGSALTAAAKLEISGAAGMVWVN